MPIVFAAAVPSSPLLFPGIGNGPRDELKPTADALEYLASELAQLKVETLIAVGNHGALQPELFTVIQDPELSCQLTEFGVLNANRTWSNDLGYAYRLREYAETRLPLVGASQPALGYGVGVPAWLLSRHLPAAKLVAIGSSLRGVNEHLDLGEAIRRVAERTTSRYALIATGDLARRPAAAAGTGTSEADGVDRLLQSSLASQAWSDIAKADEKLLDQVQAAAWRSLLVLAGALRDVAWRGEVRSYQAPFGVGLATAAFYP